MLYCFEYNQPLSITTTIIYSSQFALFNCALILQKYGIPMK